MLNKMKKYTEEEPVEMVTEEPDSVVPDEEVSGGLMSRRQ